MLYNWIKPPGKHVFEWAAQSPEGSVGSRLRMPTQPEESIKGVKLALIGADAKRADPVRRFLYGYGGFFGRHAMADLGDLRRAEESFVIATTYELISSKIVPIFMGLPESLLAAQFLAYQDAKNLINMALIAPEFNPNMAHWSRLVAPRHPLLFHLALLGYQTHRMTTESLRQLEESHCDLLRLGRTRESIEDAEPLLRDADMLAFALSALRACDAPGVSGPAPGGYTIEEACQLCRYAGFSDKLSSFGMYGYEPRQDAMELTAQAIAQMIWYFSDGFFARKGDFPVSTRDMTEYVVDFRRLQYSLTFWKSNRTGRWWMQAPISTRKKHERHRLIPCTYQDYQAACREELPERLTLAMRRFGAKWSGE